MTGVALSVWSVYSSPPSPSLCSLPLSPPLPQPFCNTQGFLFSVLSGSPQASGIGLRLSLCFTLREPNSLLRPVLLVGEHQHCPDL